MTPNEIAILISRIAVDDKEAENVLFNYLAPLVKNMVCSRLFNKMTQADQMDIFADTLKGLLNSLRKNKFDPAKHEIRNYIGGIIANKINQYYRKKSSNREFPDDHEQIAVTESPDHSVLTAIIYDEKIGHIRKNFKILKPNHRKILELTFIEGMSVHEISALLGMSQKKVTDLKHYALKKLVKACKNDNYFSIFSILMQILL